MNIYLNSTDWLDPLIHPAERFLRLAPRDDDDDVVEFSQWFIKQAIGSTRINNGETKIEKKKTIKRKENKRM